MNKREQQKEQTSKGILSASLTVFSTRDYNTATFSDISKIAKVTNGLIVQRFGSKEALYNQLVSEIIISNAPDFKNFQTLDEALKNIVASVKSIATYSIEAINFTYIVINTLSILPQRIRDSVYNSYVACGLDEIFRRAIKEGLIKNKEPFEAFRIFFAGCCELTASYCKANQSFPTDDAYLHLFKKLGALHDAKYTVNNQQSTFENISDNSLQLYNISTWYCEISEESDPRLFFPKNVLLKAGIAENSTPEQVYKLILGNVLEEDLPVIRDAIHRMYVGECVEFEYRWISPDCKTVVFRCSGKMTSNVNGISRFEGLLQNISPFKMLRNRNNTRNFFLNLLSADYEHVSYIRIGNTPDDDFVEDYKSSEFLNKLTENWGNTTNFNDRFSILFDKLMTSEDRSRFKDLDVRKYVLNVLKKSDKFKSNFKLRHFGVIYHYEIVFFADRDEDNTIIGLVCGIRMFHDVVKNIRERIGSSLDSYKKGRDRRIAELLLSNQEAGFVINPKNHTFEIYRQSNLFERRNDYIPDFEAFITTYIKHDVYFEDVQEMLTETTISNMISKLETTHFYTVNYRDISRGEPYYYIMRVSKGDDDVIAVLLTNINDEYRRSHDEKNVLEDVIRKKDEEIKDKKTVIEKTNSLIVDLLGDVINSFNNDELKVPQKFKGLTYILGTQVLEDHPELNLSRKYINQISEASVIHDFGKITIPDAILFKKDKLSADEFKVVKNHIIQNEKLLKKLNSIYDYDSFNVIMDVCKYHHERYDGNGYPNGLVGDGIPFGAQIVGLVDAYVALISDRPYRKAFDPAVAVDMIVSGACGVFNPIIVDSFKHCSEHLRDFLVNPTESDEVLKFKGSLEAPKAMSLFNSQTIPVVAFLSNQLPGGFFVYKRDSQNSLLYFNDFMVKLFRCSSRDEFIKYVNNSFKGIVHADDFDKVDVLTQKQFTESKEGLNHVSYRIVCKNGETRSIEHYGHLTNSDDHGEVCYAFIEDVTDQEKLLKLEASSRETIVSNKKRIKDESKERVKTLEGTRILVVDDNDLSRFITKDSLIDEGANVSDFSNGKDALATIKSVKPFDIILIDLIMPDMDGLELTRRIREWEEDKDIRVPIVIITSEAGDIVKKECIDEGANSCMSKPLVISELVRLLIISMKEHASKMDRKLSSTIQKANTDVLTHVKNRTAYAEKLDLLEQILTNNPYHEFGIVGADINNLKYANDKFGHDTGDIYIKNCCQMLCDIFIHSPVYRIGGDEFAVVLEGADLADYKQLLSALKEINIVRSGIEEYEKGKAHVAVGCAVYNPEIDNTVDDVIKRADAEMYKNKEEEKKRVAGSFSRE